MKVTSTTFLKIIIILIGMVALTVLIWFPQLEGRNANADLITVYLRDPFLMYMYATSIPFFVALYQSFKLSGYIDKKLAFSELSVKALHTIKLCAVIFGGMFLGSMLYIFATVKDDDPVGFLVLGSVIVFASIVIATFAAVLQKLIQSGVVMQSENDLTV
jgi:hypothetical protein